ncbi:MAG TPA: DUF6364 family protein [Thermoanaerobaculia bacterium]|jgi:hypothetical protein
MHAKLTLRLEEDLIEVAKDYAAKTGKSLSQIVADYFALLTARPAAHDEGTTPLVRSLKGALRAAAVDESDYRRHLEERYL